MAQNISIQGLLKRFWKKALFTWALVLLEGVSILLMPLVIGWAIDGLLRGEVLGLLQLILLCAILLVAGAGRRFYDTRAYGAIYRKVSNELVEGERRRRTDVSKISARASLFSELIEFLENAIPDISHQFIALTGTLIIIAAMHMKAFWVCIAGAFITAVIYSLSQKRLLRLNKGQNDEFEQQVEVISSRGMRGVRSHFRNMMMWNIRLSDLETINYAVTWAVLSGVLVCSILIVATSNTATLGQIVSVVMYVFGFIESILTFPLYYQQLIRLLDIAARLKT